MQHDIPPTSIGLFRCLQALAEETASLGLTRTSLALQDAIEACRREAGLSLPIAVGAASAPIVH